MAAARPKKKIQFGTRNVDSSPITIWVTADGKKIPVEELTDDHLFNIIKHLRGRYSSLRDEATKRGIINRDLFEDAYRSPSEILALMEKHFEVVDDE